MPLIFTSLFLLSLSSNRFHCLYKRTYSKSFCVKNMTCLVLEVNLRFTWHACTRLQLPLLNSGCYYCHCLGPLPHPGTIVLYYYCSFHKRQRLYATMSYRSMFAFSCLELCPRGKFPGQEAKYKLSHNSVPPQRSLLFSHWVYFRFFITQRQFS